ncbi:ribonuclease G [Lactiplantibacillus plantarum]|nr:ribonuclease G [Lactiplantibacillus plantarum]MCG0866037.1 ribonuclease G [Lactiplantibacillus plantarum]
MMKGNGKEVPQAVKGWNWGAFMYSIFWGIGNKTYLPLLTLIPIFNIVWVLWLVLRGMNGPGKKVIIKMSRHSRPCKRLGTEQE